MNVLYEGKCAQEFTAVELDTGYRRENDKLPFKSVANKKSRREKRTFSRPNETSVSAFVLTTPNPLMMLYLRIWPFDSVFPHNLTCLICKEKLQDMMLKNIKTI